MKIPSALRSAVLKLYNKYVHKEALNLAVAIAASFELAAVSYEPMMYATGHPTYPLAVRAVVAPPPGGNYGPKALGCIDNYISGAQTRAGERSVHRAWGGGRQRHRLLDPPRVSGHA